MSVFPLDHAAHAFSKKKLTFAIIFLNVLINAETQGKVNATALGLPEYRATGSDLSFCPVCQVTALASQSYD